MKTQHTNDLATRIFAQMPAVKGPQRKFFTILFAALMSFTGKANFRNLSRYSDACERTYSRWFKRDFPFTEFNRRLIQEEVGKWGVKIAAMDASFFPKSGKCTDGLGKFWNGCLSKSEKGLEISTVAVVDLTVNTAYSLDTRQTMGDSEESRTEQYANQFRNCLASFDLLNILYLAVDGYYSKKAFVTAVADSEVDMIGKLRRDAHLLWPFEGEQSGRGRPKKYDGKVELSGALERWTFCGQKEDGTKVYEAIVHSKSFGRKIKVVLVRKTGTKGKTVQVLLFSTDLNLEAMTLITYYQARFQIEFVFRDAKQHTGLIDCQARSAEAIETHANASLTALNLIKLEDRMSKKSCRPTVISVASWRRRKANQNLMRRLFHELEIDPTHEKVQAVFENLGEYGVIAA